MALTTLFGTAQLRLQGALSDNLDARGGTPRAPNFVVVTLSRESFQRAHSGTLEDERERFRRDMEGAMRGFVASHGWIIGGSGTLFMNIIVKEMGEDCAVEAALARSVCAREMRDDRGTRAVDVGSNPTIIGREHTPHPRGFVPVYDGRRHFSREHLLLTYRDLDLHLHCSGRNPTTLNGAPLPESGSVLRRGDVIACGDCSSAVKEIRRGAHG
ncbi:MAG: FHA domain-containing protein [Bacteroidota bacterium]